MWLTNNVLSCTRTLTGVKSESQRVELERLALERTCFASFVASEGEERLDEDAEDFWNEDGEIYVLHVRWLVTLYSFSTSEWYYLLDHSLIMRFGPKLLCIFPKVESTWKKHAFYHQGLYKQKVLQFLRAVSKK